MLSAACSPGSAGCSFIISAHTTTMHDRWLMPQFMPSFDSGSFSRTKLDLLKRISRIIFQVLEVIPSRLDQTVPDKQWYYLSVITVQQRRLILAHPYILAVKPWDKVSPQTQTADV